jgi:hypothetical protein
LEGAMANVALESTLRPLLSYGYGSNRPYMKVYFPLLCSHRCTLLPVVMSTLCHSVLWGYKWKLFVRFAELKGILFLNRSTLGDLVSAPNELQAVLIKLVNATQCTVAV